MPEKFTQEEYRQLAETPADSGGPVESADAPPPPPGVVEEDAGSEQADEEHPPSPS